MHKGKQSGRGHAWRVAALVIVVATAMVGLLVAACSGASFAVLNPRGVIAAQEKHLLLFTVCLSLVVIIPVFIMAFTIAWRYRAVKPRGAYHPDWDSNTVAETAWWGIPIIIIGILSVVIWTSSHALDPYKPLASSKKPVTVQVLSLQWKWLFIYPDQGIATVNYLAIPTDRPINFQISADSAMNSFWIPQLGGMVYAMNGMETQLHLNATSAGVYNGLAANIVGKGFSGMRFKTDAMPQAKYDAWLKNAKQKPAMLMQADYDKLSQPSANNAKQIYGMVQPDLFMNVMDKYMGMGMGSMSTMDMGTSAATSSGASMSGSSSDKQMNMEGM